MMCLFILNAFACYARPDFLTQITCVLSVYFLTDNDGIDRSKFRMLPAAIFVSFIYDIIYLSFLQNLSQEGNRVEGGMESKIKHLALYLSYITIVFKPIVFLVLWKVSSNYLTDIKQVSEAPRHTKLLKIKAEFGNKDNQNDQVPSG
jgi:hypothetical protein